MSTFPKEAIKEILENLDHKNDALWTDDGSPLVAEIQKLANDKNITRAQINEALPGFARKSATSIEEPTDDAPDAPEETQPIAAAPQDPIVIPEDNGFLSAEEEHERIRAIAQQRVRDAETALSDAKNATASAHRAEHQAEQRLSRAILQYSAKFPPMSAAANIKQHLVRQQEELRLRVTGSRFEPNAAINPVDATMMDRKRNNGRNGQGPRGQAPAPFLPRKASVNY